MIRDLIFSSRARCARRSPTWGGLGDRPASLSRELTKKFEETRRGSLRSLLAWIEATPPRGEFVLVVGGASRGEEARAEDEHLEGVEDLEERR